MNGKYIKYTSNLTQPASLVKMNKNSIVLPIKTDDILKAHEAHGNDFLIFDLENIREYKDLAQYIGFKIKLADRTVKPIKYWNINGNAIKIASGAKKPEMRKYEQMCIAVSESDEQENDNIKALKLICEAFEHNFNDMFEKGILSKKKLADKKKKALGTVKLDDGTEVVSVKLLSDNLKTPMQKVANSKEETDENGDPIEINLEKPLFWISIPKQKYFKDGKKPEEVQFEDKCYEESGKPIYIHKYQAEFYDMEDFTVDTNGSKLKRIYKKLDHVDNTNIQHYLTRGTSMIGPIRLEMVSTGTITKLDIMMTGRTYLKIAEVKESVEGSYGNEEVDQFMDKYGSIASKKKSDDFDDEFDDIEDN